MTEINITLEEYGEEEQTIEVTLQVKLYPGEPMVRYYPDGSGYPGSPPEAEVVRVLVDGVWAFDGHEVKLTREQLSELEEELFMYFYNNPEVWEDTAFEEGYYDDV